MKQVLGSNTNHVGYKSSKTADAQPKLSPGGHGPRKGNVGTGKAGSPTANGSGTNPTAIPGKATGGKLNVSYERNHNAGRS